MKQPLLLVVGTALMASRSHRAQHFARYFIERDVEIDIVGSVNYRRSIVELDAGMEASLNGLLRQPVRVQRERNARTLVVQKLPRLHMGGWAQSLWMYRALRPHLRPNYAVAIVGHPDHAFLALLLKRRGKARRLVYDDWDYFPAAAHTGVEARAAAWNERLLISAADAVASVSPRLEALRQQQGAKRVIVIPNGVNMSLFRQSVNGNGHAPADGAPPTLVYMGNLGHLWGVDIAIEAMPLVRRQFKDARLLITGRGHEEATLQAQVRRLGMEDAVTFLGMLDYQDLLTTLHNASIGLAPYRKHTWSEYSAPQKIIEYMAAGLPVVATRQGYAQYLIDHSQAGQAVDITPEAFSQAIGRFLADPAYRNACADNAEQFARGYDWEVLLGRFTQMLDEL